VIVLPLPDYVQHAVNHNTDFIGVKQFSGRAFAAAATPVSVKPCHSSSGKISKFESLKV